MNNELRIVFMGTPDFAVPSLRTLLADGCNVVAVVTQPDRPKGRKRELTPPPVKAEALLHGIPVLQPERLRRPEAVAELAAFRPDLIVTAAYGQILPKSVLDMPAHGCVNLHGSLLPRYRGGAPIQHAIMNGETVTGVTLMYMAEGLDTGDMLAKAEVPIGDDDTAGTIFDKLSVTAAELLRRSLPELLAGRLARQQQPEAEATYAPNITREDERIDWSRPADELFNRIRGLNPWPVAFTTWNGDVFKVWASRKPAAAGIGQPPSVAPGTVLRVSAEGIAVQTGGGELVLTEVQPAGKKAMSAGDFARGGAMQAGTVLGWQAE
ncbi:MAG: methionyl-tRNA formyltransferase [Paenibacillaceae bacterium]|nr:methionyl-tRNA formyltransferase [Paenibacillaceae bacterium]